VGTYMPLVQSSVIGVNMNRNVVSLLKNYRRSDAED